MQSKFVEFTGLNTVAVRTEDVSSDNLAPMEVIIRNEASLVSAGTELAGLEGMGQHTGFPMRPGYASIGRILAKGSGVDDFAVGDRVFYAGTHAQVQRFTHGQDHQWGRLYPVPENIPATEAAYVCLAEIAMIAPILSGSDIDDTVAVFGLGVIGNLCAQIYRAMGCAVIGLDPVEKRCAITREVGIAEVLNVSAGEQVAAVKRLTGGNGAHITVDAVGHCAVIRSCVAATAHFGTTVLLGTPRAPMNGDLTEIFQDVHMRGLTLRGAHMWQLPPSDTHECKRTVAWAYRTIFDWMGKGMIQVKPLISHVVDIYDAPDVYRGLQKEKENYWGVIFKYPAV